MVKVRPYVYTLSYPENYPEFLKAGTIFYIGKGTDRRINKHEPEAKRGVRGHKCNVIRKIWDNGGHVVKNIIAYFDTHEEAYLYEVALIFFLPGLANETDGGDGLRGLSEEARLRISEATRKRMNTEEARRKISEQGKGRLHSEETRRKMSETHKGLPGHAHSEDARQKMSQTRKGRKLSEQTRLKMQERVPWNKGKKTGLVPWNKGTPLSDETKQKLSIAKKGRSAPNKGKSPSEESRRKMSESQKQRYQSQPLRLTYYST